MGADISYDVAMPRALYFASTALAAVVSNRILFADVVWVETATISAEGRDLHVGCAISAVSGDEGYSMEEDAALIRSAGA